MCASKVDPRHATKLALSLNQQRESGKHCDVCVCVSDRRYLAHKCILSASSTKLDLLILDSIGHNSSNQDIEIEVQGISPIGFEKLLDYFYLGELKVEQETVMPVWMTAAYLELPEVVAMCNEFCQQTVAPLAAQHLTDENKQPKSKDCRVDVASNDNQLGKSKESGATWLSEEINGDSNEYLSEDQNKTLSASNRTNPTFSLDDKDACESIMAEVEQLRQQHQQLQKLQQEQARLQGSNVSKNNNPPPTINVTTHPETKRRKKSSLGDMDRITVQVTSNTPVLTPVQKAPPSVEVVNRLPPDFRLVDEDFCQSLYGKYPHVTKEQMEITNCSALELLDKSKARKRKSVEQNSLNNVVRWVLDTMKIVDSTDPRVEDALFLIMDRFDCLKKTMNDPTIRRSLLVKVKHSIHCKKWRVKQSMNKKKLPQDGDIELRSESESVFSET